MQRVSQIVGRRIFLTFKLFLSKHLNQFNASYDFAGEMEGFQQEDVGFSCQEKQDYRLTR